MKKLCALLIFSCLLGCVSSGDDYRIAAEVEHYLSVTGVVPEDTREADQTHKGRIVYVGPGRKGNPHFTYYEVTSPEQIALLEAAAKTALLHIPDANTITLRFMEKQVFHASANGGGYRGREKEIRKIVVRRQTAT